MFVSVSDPVGSGLVASLARPGANITGVLQYEASITGKWLAMLKEIAPNLTHAALLANPKTTPYDFFLRSAQSVAPSVGIEVVACPVENDSADIGHRVETLSSQPNRGLLLLPDSTTLSHRDLIVSLAARHRMPAVYPFRIFVATGGLMSYDTDQVELFRQAAPYVDRILRGTKPSDLPVQAPTKYQTALNLKAAAAQGLRVPPSLLVRADEVIEQARSLLHLLGSPVGTQRQSVSGKITSAIGGAADLLSLDPIESIRALTQSGGKPDRNLAAQQAP